MMVMTNQEAGLVPEGMLPGGGGAVDALIFTTWSPKTKGCHHKHSSIRAAWKCACDHNASQQRRIARGELAGPYEPRQIRRLRTAAELDRYPPEGPGQRIYWPPVPAEAERAVSPDLQETAAAAADGGPTRAARAAAERTAEAARQARW